MNLDLIAINNLENLSEFNNKKYINIINKITIDIKDKDDKYENLTDISDIEFAVYFTFHHILTSNNNNKLIKKYSRKNILKLVDLSINNLYDVFGYPENKEENENRRFYNLLDEIEVLSQKAYDNLYFYNCYYVFNDWFTYVCSGFKSYHEITMNMNDILHGYISNSRYNIFDDLNEDDFNDSFDIDETPKSKWPHFSSDDDDTLSDNEKNSDESDNIIDEDKLVEPNYPPPTDYSIFNYFYSNDTKKE